MKWLYLFFIFNTSGGDLEPKARVSTVFPTQKECDAFGKTAEREVDYEDKALRSFSVCIPESEYKKPLRKMQSQKF